MSNDLISRSAMIKKICGSKCGCNMEECGDDICEAVEMVKEIPTAYDVEKVVEQLEENYSCDVGNLKMISLDKAIEIVRGGEQE